MEQENHNIERKSGNNCGHDPEHPRFFSPPAKHADRPKILQRIIAAVREYFYSPQSTLPSLNACNESERQQRSERREACCAILGAILHYTDLVTLRVGIPQPDGSMAGLTMPTLAELSGLGERRAERAIADLKTAGIITVHEICEKLDEITYKGYAAIRTVSRKLFEAMGLGRWLEHERRRAKERRDKRTEKARRKALANVQMAGAALEQQLKDLKRKQAEDQAAGIEPQRGGLSPVAELCIAAMRQSLGVKPDTS